MVGSLRSIPACAGEPPTPPSATIYGWVYPRVCGGTSTACPPPTGAPGLSPRVRGNPTARSLSPAGAGSIPACAGEPLSLIDGCRPFRVYPRVCGGTPDAPQCYHIWVGLSPRVRGNRSAMWYAPPFSRSIPACAGEPAAAASSRSRSRVYPRVCGGTISWRLNSMYSSGLSPRVRGNLLRRRGRG